MVEREAEIQQESSGDQYFNNEGTEETVPFQSNPIVQSVIECSQSGVKERIKSDHWPAIESMLNDYHEFLEENYSQKRSSLPADIVTEAFIQTNENGDEIDFLETRVRRLSEETGIRYKSLNSMTRSMIRMVTKCFANKCPASELRKRRGKRIAIVEGSQRHSRPKIGSDWDRRID
jgi:hypothetical protein